jgi:hypothetical protein
MEDREDYSELRETNTILELTQDGIARADLKDYGGTATVTMEWDLNEDAIRDKVFRLKINNQEALLDLNELLHYTRVL